ncbi:MAG: VWA domain-containing protein [Thermoanaerobaculia bacterium]
MRILLALLSLSVVPVAARAQISVSLDSPSPFEPAYGQVDIEAVVISDEEIERVSFYLDDIVVGELTEPPYRLSVDVGQENTGHRIEVVAYAVSGATGSTAIETPTFRVDEEVSINLQQLYVTVTRRYAGPRGAGPSAPGAAVERVLDLTRDDFAVFDHSARQNLVTFARGDVPFTAVVLLDSSVSMKGAPLESALTGAEAFLTSMDRLDEGKLLVFSDRILHSTPFTTFPEVLTAGLGNVDARGGTALNDHLYLALKQLEERQGRRVVILLSDGVDSHSVLSVSDVALKARRSQALIYWLRLPYRGKFPQQGNDLPGISSAWRNTEQYRSEYQLLKNTIEESGGRVQDLVSLDQIEAAFRDILAELRDQYVLGFYPQNLRHNGGWREIGVRVRDRTLDVRCRDGYLDF